MGPLESVERIKARPWSIVLRARSNRAVAYFKASGSGGAHESSLIDWLQQRFSAHVPTLLATHETQPWMLLADAGTPLHDLKDSFDPQLVLESFLPVYARMQMACASEIPALLELGLPDRRLSRLPELLRSLISADSNVGARYAGLLSGLEPAVRELLPAFEQHCLDLDASACAVSLDHGDLHAVNLMISDGDTRLCDWGDSCVTHPFCTLLVTLEMMVRDVPEPDRTLRARALRDAYLEAWTRLGSLASLRFAFRRALWIARVVRVLDWVQMLDGADRASFDRWCPHVGNELSRWVERFPLLTEPDPMDDAVR